ncbi:MAG: TIGR04086 family membrane protein [Lachnospiraceae bacterium]|nr:TIGR04086 family membrane protein [Lachnospiraceae bacterium]
MMAGGMKMMAVLKALVVSYVLTGIVLVLLAFGVYKLELSEAAVNIMVIVVYLAMTFLGGIITGKQVKVKKYLWGALYGFLYIALIFCASMVVSKGFDLLAVSSVTAMFLCVGGGIFGGMIS